MASRGGWDTDLANSRQPPAPLPLPSADSDAWPKQHPILFSLFIIVLAMGMAWLFRPVPATTKFDGRWQVFTSDFQFSLPSRYVGGIGTSGAAGAIAEAARTVPFYEEIAKPYLADLPTETVFWAIAPIDCCQTWGEVALSFGKSDADPQGGHSGVTEVLILKFAAEDEETLSQFRDDLVDSAYKTQDERIMALADYQTIRLVEDEGDNRHLTYLHKDHAAFWVIDFSADKDKFNGFVPLFERSAHSLRLPAAK